MVHERGGQPVGIGRHRERADVPLSNTCLLLKDSSERLATLHDIGVDPDLLPDQTPENPHTRENNNWKSRSV